MKAKTALPTILIVFLALASVHAQEVIDDEAEETAALFSEDLSEALPEEDFIYVIRGLKFFIDGISRPYALINNGEFIEGERIFGKANFEKYLQRKRQLLLNKRILDEVTIEYSLGNAEEDGVVPVKLLVDIVDSKNLVILPYPKYDSNEGFSLTLKLRHYNFFGTMSTLAVDLGYQRNTDSQNVINFSIDSDIPFYLFGLNWIVNFDNTIRYTGGEPLYYQNVTGLSVQLPWRTTTFTVGFNQYLTVNEEITDEYKDLYGTSGDFYVPYGTTELFAAWKIPLPFEVLDFGGVSYTPKISTKINYPTQKLDEPHKPVTILSHSISFGHTDWIGNYRKEFSAYFTNSYSIFMAREDAPFLAAIDLGATFHWPFTKFLGVSSRIKYRQWWQWSFKDSDWIPYYYAGDTLRGVIDTDLRADAMLSLNMEVPVRVLRFWPSEWFNRPGLHFFDVEVFFSPFLDLALLKGPYNNLKTNSSDGTSFKFSDMVSTTGLEIIVYSGYFRSLKLRGSLGYNLNRAGRNGIPLKWGWFPQWDEIYVGLDFHY